MFKNTYTAGELIYREEGIFLGFSRIVAGQNPSFLSPGGVAAYHN
jgi:hypothetical protein